MTPRHLPSSILYPLVTLAFAAVAHAQSGLGGTEYGKSQNTTADLANSLVPGKPNLTKGEKKSEVDPKTLQSKQVKDKTFEGGLNDIGLDWDGTKVGKLHGNAEKDARNSKGAGSDEKAASKQTDVSDDKAAKASDSGLSSANSPAKEQKTEESKAEGKSVSKEKTSVANPDGNH